MSNLGHEFLGRTGSGKNASVENEPSGPGCPGRPGSGGFYIQEGGAPRSVRAETPPHEGQCAPGDVAGRDRGAVAQGDLEAVAEERRGGAGTEAGRRCQEVGGGPARPGERRG